MAKEAVSRSTYYRWVDQLKAGIPEPMVAEEAAREKAESGEAAFVPITLRASPVEIELPNGGVVRLPLGVGQVVLVEFIRAVGALRPWCDGFCIWYKRLERGTFQLLTTTNDDQGIELNDSQLVRLLGGLDLRTGRRRKRYRRPC